MRAGAKLYIFPYPGTQDITIRVGFGMQAAKTCHVPISTFCCTM